MRFVLAILFAVSLLTADGQSKKARVFIAAASDLKFALDSVIAVFEKQRKQTGIEVSYGSSGKLYEQIRHGAPFDIFFSADIDYPIQLERHGFVIENIETYGYGRLAVWMPRSYGKITAVDVLLSPAVDKIAIANPLHAPYGRRAEEALQHYGLYDQVKGKLVFGENVSQAAQFVNTGAADAGIIALSLAVSPAMKNRGTYFVIPTSAHKPLQQGFVRLRTSKDNSVAADFAQFVRTKEVKSIFLFFGFSDQPQ